MVSLGTEPQARRQECVSTGNLVQPCSHIRAIYLRTGVWGEFPGVACAFKYYLHGGTFVGLQVSAGSWLAVAARR